MSTPTSLLKGLGTPIISTKTTMIPVGKRLIKAINPRIQAVAIIIMRQQVTPTISSRLTMIASATIIKTINILITIGSLL